MIECPLEHTEDSTWGEVFIRYDGWLNLGGEISRRMRKTTNGRLERYSVTLGLNFDMNFDLNFQQKPKIHNTTHNNNHNSIHNTIHIQKSVVSNVHRWFLVLEPLSCIVTFDQHFSIPLAIVAASDFLFTQLSSKTEFQHVGESIIRVG